MLAANEAKNTESIVAAVVSSLVIVHVFNDHNTYLTREVFTALLNCLKLPANEAVCTVLMKEIYGYDETVLR